MFTGLVEELGRLEWLRRGEGEAQLAVQAPGISPGVRIGDSIAVNGCCLTVTVAQDGLLVFDLLEETLKKTNLGALKPGSGVNLERSLAVGGRLGGHFVQGHVDAIGKIRSIEARGQDHVVDVELPDAIARLCIDKGSLAIDGISLTIASLKGNIATFWITPHTWQHTNLHAAKIGQRVNLEADMLAKHVDSLLAARTNAGL